LVSTFSGSFIIASECPSG